MRLPHRLRLMLGLKTLRTAAVVLGGTELAEKIKKQQFKAAMPEIWQRPSLRNLEFTSNCSHLTNFHSTLNCTAAFATSVHLVSSERLQQSQIRRVYLAAQSGSYLKRHPRPTYFTSTSILHRRTNTLLISRPD
jgi:hypothetical protein